MKRGGEGYMAKESRSLRRAGTTARARELRRGDNFAEAKLWDELKDRKLGGYKFVRQYPVGPYIADFMCRQRRLVVEVDGSQHAESSRDRRRDEHMRAQGIWVVRFWNVDVLAHIDSVCETILAVLEGRYAEAPDLRFVSGAKGSVTKEPAK